ncbi:MAG: hypothetical protein HQ498_03755 [Pseudohongiella sp.]|jgi:hypothetical protein|nr:hypothetical protein [Pseudohongiella sp.]
MTRHFLQHPTLLGLSVLLLALFGPEPVLAATTNLPGEETDFAWVWNLLIAVIVLAVAAASAVLPISALRAWTGQWRLVAALPLLVLLIWVGMIIIAKLISVDSHQLWSLEVFAWAMLTLIYMVTVMSAKRIFEKKDLENSQSE